MTRNRDGMRISNNFVVVVVVLLVENGRRIRILAELAEIEVDEFGRRTFRFGFGYNVVSTLGFGC